MIRRMKKFRDLCMKKILVFFFLCWLSSLPACWAQDETAQAGTPQAATATELEAYFKLLPPQVIGAQRILLEWNIAEDHFILGSKLRFQSETPGIEIGAPELPVGYPLEDPFFGSLTVYRNKLSVELPLLRAVNAGDELILKVTYQGCRDLKNCFPLHFDTRTLRLPAQRKAYPRATPNSTPASEADNLLTSELAFILSSAQESDKIILRWTIADGYYLYRKDLHFTPSVPRVVGTPVLPAGIMKKDDFFGDVEVYADTLEVEFPLAGSSGVDSLSLHVRYRGCAEGSLCYPPEEKTVEFSFAEEPSAALISPGFSSSGGFSLGEQGGDFLPPEEAFIFTASLKDPRNLLAYWKIAEGYYLYRDRLSFTALNEGVQLGEIDLPQGEEKEDPEFGKVQVFRDSLSIIVPIAETGGADAVQLEVGYQGCAEAGLCYPPESKKLNVALPDADDFATPEQAAPKVTSRKEQAVVSASPQGTVPVSSESAAPQSEQDRLAQTIAQGNVFNTMLIFFGLGLLLAFTPCVFPMVPILSGIIVGQGKSLTTRRAFFISFTYVMAMALTYTVAGLFAGLLGHNLQAALQTPWVLYTFAGVFVLLSLSMFGFYDLQLPHSLQSKLNELSNRQQGGTFVGAAIMGFLSALIVGPCIAPPLAGALLYLSQASQSGGSVWLGGGALFALSLGMGLPLILVGVSAGHFLPRAGGWMDTVKHIFGILLLGVAVWMVERVVPTQVAMLLWGALFIVPAIYLGALDSLPPDTSGWRKFWKGIGVLLLIYGILLVIGAARGSQDIFQPLRSLAPMTTEMPAQARAGAQHGLNFKRVRNLAELEREVQQASANGQGVMLDFYADWCISCKEMERFTFSDPKVVEALAGVVLLQADVTANSADDKTLLKHFSLFGPPGLIFYDPSGREQSARRIVGFMAAEPFAAHVAEIFSPR